MAEINLNTFIIDKIIKENAELKLENAKMEFSVLATSEKLEKALKELEDLKSTQKVEVVEDGAEDIQEKNRVSKEYE